MGEIIEQGFSRCSATELLRLQVGIEPTTVELSAK